MANKDRNKRSARKARAEERAKLDPFYMSYFVPWNSYKNYQIAKAHGFHALFQRLPGQG